MMRMDPVALQDDLRRAYARQAELLDALHKAEREIECLLAENTELRTKLFNAEWIARRVLADEPPGWFVEGVE